MTWIYEVMEIFDRRNKPLGRYRLVRWPDEDRDHVEGLCGHSHETREEAVACQQAAALIDYEFRERIAGTERPRS